MLYCKDTIFGFLISEFLLLAMKRTSVVCILELFKLLLLHFPLRFLWNTCCVCRCDLFDVLHVFNCQRSLHGVYFEFFLACDVVTQHSVQTSNPSRNTHHHLSSPTRHQTLLQSSDTTNIEAYARQHFNTHKQRGLFGKTIEVNSLLSFSKVTSYPHCRTAIMGLVVPRLSAR